MTEAAHVDEALKAQAAAWPGVNALTETRVAALVRDARVLRLGVERDSGGATIVDAGIAHPGGVEAGRRIAEICMGGLGSVTLQTTPAFPRWPWQVAVSSSNPVLACLGSQYAGWSLSHGSGKEGFMALGSGPGRAAACKEELFAELGYRDRADSAALVLEVGKRPPAEVIAKVSRDTGVPAERLTFILTPTESLAGGTQVVARVLEVAMHKAHALHFPLSRVVDGMGSAPVPPPGKDFLTAMGRTNDAILFGGQVHLFVRGPDDEAERLAAELPSRASRDYGKPFGQVFKAAGYDFYKIDPMLFAPAAVTVTALDSGRSYFGGAFDPELLALSFGG